MIYVIFKCLDGSTRVEPLESVALSNGNSSINGREVADVVARYVVDVLPRLRSDQLIVNADISTQDLEQMSRPVSDLNLSYRVRSCLARRGITSVGELVPRTPDDLLSIINFGQVSLNEIRNKLAYINMKLRDDV